MTKNRIMFSCRGARGCARLFVSLCLALTASLVMPACGDGDAGSQQQPPGTNNDPSQETCTRDDDCGDGQICISACYEIEDSATCTASAGCVSGQEAICTINLGSVDCNALTVDACSTNSAAGCTVGKENACVTMCEEKYSQAEPCRADPSCDWYDDGDYSICYETACSDLEGRDACDSNPSCVFYSDESEEGGGWCDSRCYQLDNSGSCAAETSAKCAWAEYSFCVHEDDCYEMDEAQCAAATHCALDPTYGCEDLCWKLDTETSCEGAYGGKCNVDSQYTCFPDDTGVCQ